MDTKTTGENPAQPYGEEGVSDISSDSVSQNRLKDFFLSQLGGDEDRQQNADPAESGTEAQSYDTEDYSLSDSDATGEKEVLSNDSQEGEDNSEGFSKNVQKRIDALTAKRKAAEEEAQALKDQLAQIKDEYEKAKSQSKEEFVIKSDPANPYSHLNNLAEIESEATQARQVRRWCEEHADGTTYTDKDGVEREYTPDDIRRIKLNAIDALEEHLPKRLKYVSDKSQVDQLADTEYRWWKDKSSRERQIAESFIKAFPEVIRYPDYKMVVGDYVRGMLTREAKAKGGNTSQVKAPIQPRGNAVPTQRSDARSTDALNRFSKTGNRDDFAAVIASKFI
jgi:hypothetical protein